MNVLAFDCAGSFCAAAAIDADGRTLSARSKKMARGQAEALMPMIEEVLGEAGLRWDDVGLVGVTVGPGAFTGIRIGLAAARGVALALGAPVIGIESTEAVAFSIPGEERQGATILAVLDGKRADLFVQAFGPDLRPLGAIEALLPEEIGKKYKHPLLLAGNGAHRAAAHLDGAKISCVETAAPEALALLAKAKWSRGEGALLHPLYLAPPDVTIQK